MSFHGSLVLLVFPERVRFTRLQSQTSASLFLHHISWFFSSKAEKEKSWFCSVRREEKEPVRHQSAKLVAGLVGVEGWFLWSLPQRLCSAQTRQDRSCLLHSCPLQESEPEGCF